MILNKKTMSREPQFLHPWLTDLKDRLRTTPKTKPRRGLKIFCPIFDYEEYAIKLVRAAERKNRATTANITSPHFLHFHLWLAKANCCGGRIMVNLKKS